MGRRKGNSAFPVARIKKMMQADDDVGKIATVTPVLVAKALECMMEHVLTEAADVARGRHTKTVTPQHLQYCVAHNDHFDFLRPTLAHVTPLDDQKTSTANPAGTTRRTRAKRPRSPMVSQAAKRSEPSLEDVEMEDIPEKANHLTDVPAPGKRHKVRAPATASISAPALPAVGLPNTNTDPVADDDDDNYDDDDDEDAGKTPALSAPNLPPLHALHAATQDSDEAKPSERVSVHALLS